MGRFRAPAYADRVFVADTLSLVLTVAALALCAWALIDAAVRRKDAFPAVGRQTKALWLVILGVSAAVEVVWGAFSLLGVPAIIASVVYLVDVRPKVRDVTRGSRW